jgi:hypothetical protein
MVTSHGFAATRGRETRGREVHENNEFVSDFHVIFRHGRARPGLSRPSTWVSFRAAETLSRWTRSKLEMVVSLNDVDSRDKPPLPVLGGVALRSAGWMAQCYTNLLRYISREDGKSAASWSCGVAEKGA